MPKKLTKCECGSQEFLAKEIIWHEADWDEDTKQFLLHKDIDNETELFKCQNCGKEYPAYQFKFDYC